MKKIIILFFISISSAFGQENLRTNAIKKLSDDGKYLSTKDLNATISLDFHYNKVVLYHENKVAFRGTIKPEYTKATPSRIVLKVSDNNGKDNYTIHLIHAQDYQGFKIFVNDSIEPIQYFIK